MIDIDRNEQYEKYKGIIIYMAKKFHYMDDMDELIAWCNYGYAELLYKHEIEGNFNFTDRLFLELYKILYKVYYNTDSRTKENLSLYDVMGNGEADNTERIELIEDEMFPYNTKDIVGIVLDAMFEEEEVSKRVVVDSLILGKSEDEIMLEYKLKKITFKRIMRRAENSIKTHLLNNGTISEYLLYGKPEQRKEYSYKEPTQKDLGKIKYIRYNYEHLGIEDIASIMGLDVYPLKVLMNYPTRSYLRIVPDESIKGRADDYMLKHYPERIPGEVTSYIVGETT